MRLKFATACAFGLATLAVSQAPIATLSTYDARPLIRAFDVSDFPHRLPLHAAFSDPEPGGSERRLLGEDVLADFVRGAIGDESGETRVEIAGGLVFVTGAEPAHAKAAALMEYLHKTLLQEVTVEVFAVAGAPDLPGGVLTAADTERLLAGKPAPVEIGRTVVVLARPGGVRAGKHTSFVSDYDVEVAQSAAISDPIIRILEEGLDFQAAVGQATDGRLSLKVGSTRCALAEALAPRTVASARLGDIQLPKVRTSVVVGSGFLDDGGGLLLRHEGGLGSATLVRVRRVPGPKASDNTGHHVVFVDDLLGTPLRVPIPPVRDDQRTGDHPRREPIVEPAGDSVVSSDLVEGVVRAVLGEDSDASFVVSGTRIHVRGPAAAAERVRAALLGVAKSVSRNVVIDFRIGRVDQPGDLLPRSPGDIAARLPVAVSAPVALSDQFLVACGLEQTAIIDQDVEIAQQSQIADPVVAPLFSGYVLSGVVSASGSDRVELVLDLQHQDVLPWPNAGFPSRAENVGPVDLPQIEGAAGRHRVLLESGRWTVLTTSNPAEGAALVIVARARW